MSGQIERYDGEFAEEVGVSTLARLNGEPCLGIRMHILTCVLFIILLRIAEDRIYYGALAQRPGYLPLILMCISVPIPVIQ